MRIVLYAILAYILFLFIFRLVIPVFLASRKIKRGFREMSARMNQSDGQQKMQEQQAQGQQGQGQQGFGPQASAPKEQPRPKSDDYIDFEEVK